MSNQTVHPVGEGEGRALGPVLGPVAVDTFAGRVHVEWDPQAAVTPLGQLPFFTEFLQVSGLFDPWVSDCPLYLVPDRKLARIRDAACPAFPAEGARHSKSSSGAGMSRFVGSNSQYGRNRCRCSPGSWLRRSTKRARVKRHGVACAVPARLPAQAGWRRDDGGCDPPRPARRSA